MIMRTCPKCKTVLTGADIETDPYEARVLLKGGYAPIGYDAHQAILFVMAPDEPPSQLVGLDGKLPEPKMELRRYINIDKLPAELKGAVMGEVRKHAPKGGEGEGAN